MAKAVRYRKSPRQGKFVSVTMFRALESEVLQMRDTMEAVRHESSDNLRRCGELQCERTNEKGGGRLRRSEYRH